MERTNPMPPTEIDRLLREIPGITNGAIRQLQRFAAFLQEWNQKINLVSRKDVPYLWEHHLLPSLLVLHVVDFSPGESVLDIGSGGGFPGVPLKIARPDLQIVLVESIRKKARFLQDAIDHLGLGGITVVNERVEQLAGRAEFRERFHTVTARAVADVATLYRWGAPLLVPGGRWVLWKGEQDVSDLEAAQKQLGFQAEVRALPTSLARHHPRWATTRWFVLRKP